MLFKTLQDLFSDESRWTTGALARTSSGEALDHPCSRSAVSWCLLGGIGLLYPMSNPLYYSAVRIALEIVESLGYSTIVSFNDSSKTTISDIQKVASMITKEFQE